MFRCKQCGKVSEPGEKSFQKVISTRSKSYTTEETTYYRGEPFTKTKILGRGTEIAKEIQVCEDCSEKK